MTSVPTTTNKRGRARAAGLGLAAAGVLSAGLLGATGASASGPPYTHNNAYSYVGVHSGPSYTSGQEVADLYNNSTVTMRCYTDAQNVTDRNYSNYNSSRWFLINYSGGSGYVHSSYVYQQVGVGHC